MSKIFYILEYTVIYPSGNSNDNKTAYFKGSEIDKFISFFKYLSSKPHIRDIKGYISKSEEINVAQFIRNYY